VLPPAPIRPIRIRFVMGHRFLIQPKPASDEGACVGITLVSKVSEPGR
jgi:hypothetical protein